MQYEIRLSPAAKQDLADLYDYIADRSSPARAIAYIERVGSAIASLQRFPERGTKRDDIRNNLRVLGFERRVSIAFFVEEPFVRIARVLYGGRDLARIPWTE